MLGEAELLLNAPETAAERDRLKEVNAELVEALENILSEAEKAGVSSLYESPRGGKLVPLGEAMSSARNTIAKTKGNKS